MFESILKWLVGVPLAILAFLTPVSDAMFGVCALIGVDLIVGVWAAKVRGEKILSWKLRQTVTRKVAPYLTALVVAQHIEAQFFAGTWLAGVPLMKGFAGFIAMSEGKSVFERLGEITGLDFWKFFQERLQPKVKPDA